MRISFRIGRLDIKNSIASWKMFVEDSEKNKTADRASDRYTNKKS